jgi:methyl-accepting chemotaxis protein
VASRVLMLDAANAVACHHAADVERARASNDELAGAIKDFSAAAEGVRGAIAAAVASLGTTSDRLTSLAGTASQQVGTAVGAADQTAENVRTTASAAEELSESIAEIHHQATRSAEMAQTSVSQVDGANATIRSLSDAVEKIGSVVGLISDIAAQTNLLALNATIEAARAGEAGRGFAVVAAEVKSLATQTAKATGEIGQQIALVQEATRRSVAEIDHTRKTISEITATTGAVAASVTQQTSATHSIASVAGRMAAHAATVADALEKVQTTLGETKDAAGFVIGLSRDLADCTGRLDGVMATLFATVSRHGTGTREFRALK